MKSKIPTVSEIRNIIENIEDEKYRYAFMYQFLIGGELSEVCGENAPKGNDAHQITFKINGEIIPAVLFIVKNIKPKERGEFRACAIPLDPKYEPWAKPLLEWFREYGERCPFWFGKKKIKPRSNQRYLQLKAEKVFNNFIWQKAEYRRAPGEIVKRRYNPFRSSELRKLRRKNLKEFYLFNEVDLALFGAWNEPVSDVRIRSEIENILSTELKKDDIESLKKRSKKYFEMLLRPLSELGKEIIPVSRQIRDRADLYRAGQRASDIIELVENINMLGQWKFDALFFKENMRFIYEILSSCNTPADFRSKIASLSTLFDVDLKPLRKLVKAPRDMRSIKLIETWLQENDIEYDPNMIKTWLNISTFRNMELHSEKDAKKYMKLLDYFGEPTKLPPYYSSLWDKILDKFIVGLKHLLDILNNL